MGFTDLVKIIQIVINHVIMVMLIIWMAIWVLIIAALIIIDMKWIVILAR